MGFLGVPFSLVCETIDSTISPRPARLFISCEKDVATSKKFLSSSSAVSNNLILRPFEDGSLLYTGYTTTISCIRLPCSVVESETLHKIDAVLLIIEFAKTTTLERFAVVADRVVPFTSCDFEVVVDEYSSTIDRVHRVIELCSSDESRQ